MFLIAGTQLTRGGKVATRNGLSIMWNGADVAMPYCFSITKPGSEIGFEFCADSFEDLDRWIAAIMSLGVVERLPDVEITPRYMPPRAPAVAPAAPAAPVSAIVAPVQRVDDAVFSRHGVASTSQEVPAPPAYVTSAAPVLMPPAYGSTDAAATAARAEEVQPYDPPPAAHAFHDVSRAAALCTHCGSHVLNARAKFCPACGLPISAPMK